MRIILIYFLLIISRFLCNALQFGDVLSDYYKSVFRCNNMFSHPIQASLDTRQSVDPNKLKQEVKKEFIQNHSPLFVFPCSELAKMSQLFPAAAFIDMGSSKTIRTNYNTELMSPKCASGVSLDPQSRAMKLINESNTSNVPIVGIVGGHYSRHHWPFIVAINEYGSYHCGGSIVSEMWIVSAAHCFYPLSSTSYYDVEAGILRRSGYNPHKQIRRIIRIIIHEKYAPSHLLNDIALCKVDKRFHYNNIVAKVLLPGPYDSKPRLGEYCKAIGWGTIYEHGPQSDILKEVDVQIQECQNAEDIYGTAICAGIKTGGQDACQGDSGGPFICLNYNGHWYLAGIVSNGNGCAQPNTPAAYTKVFAFRKWINSVISESKYYY